MTDFTLATVDAFGEYLTIDPTPWNKDKDGLFDAI